MRIRQRQITAAAILVIATAHFILLGYFLVRTVITSPISDMFTYPADYLRFRAGQIGVADYLWAPHGEHRLLWIRLLTWVDVELFHTRGIAFIAAATASICLTAILLWHALHHSEPRLKTALTLLAPMLVLTSANVVDASVPINTTYPITIFFAVSAIIMLAGVGGGGRNANLQYAGALLSAIAAGLATAAGVLVWPILVWTAWRNRIPRRFLAILTAVALVFCLLYCYRLPAYGLVPALAMDAASFASPAHIFKLADYFIAFLGLPLTRAPALATAGRVVGVAFLLTGISAVGIATFSSRLRAPLDRAAVGLIMLALGSAALAALGRSDLVSEVPVRYTIFVTALHVGLLYLLLPRAVRIFATPSARALVDAAALAFACAADPAGAGWSHCRGNCCRHRA
jgi:hypothetical protein